MLDFVDIINEVFVDIINEVVENSIDFYNNTKPHIIKRRYSFSKKRKYRKMLVVNSLHDLSISYLAMNALCLRLIKNRIKV